jgi:periplasmic divalent cation tolerance protein
MRRRSLDQRTCARSAAPGPAARQASAQPLSLPAFPRRIKRTSVRRIREGVMDAVDIWINCPDRETARALGERLVETRIAACANIHPEVESIYHWQGAVERATEVPLLVKTVAAHFDAVAATARAMHPDTVPAIHAVRAAAVTADYLAWLRDETRPR